MYRIQSFSGFPPAVPIIFLRVIAKPLNALVTTNALGSTAVFASRDGYYCVLSAVDGDESEKSASISLAIVNPNSGGGSNPSEGTGGGNDGLSPNTKSSSGVSGSFINSTENSAQIEYRL